MVVNPGSIYTPYTDPVPLIVEEKKISKIEEASLIYSFACTHFNSNTIIIFSSEEDEEKKKKKKKNIDDDKVR